MEHLTFILAAIICFGASIIGGMVGGSFLILVPGLIMLGLEPHYVIAVSRVFMVAVGLSFINYWKNGNVKIKKNWYHALLFLVGTLIGSVIVINISEDLLQLVIGLLMIGVALFLFLDKNFGLKTIKTKIKKRYIFAAAVSFFILGIYEGIYAAASAIIMIMLLTLFLKTDFKNAVGTARLFDFLAGVVATIVFASKGLIDYSFALPMAVFCFAGSWVGSHITLKKNIRFIKYVLIVVAILFAIKLLVLK